MWGVGRDDGDPLSVWACQDGSLDVTDMRGDGRDVLTGATVDAVMADLALRLPAIRAERDQRRTLDMPPYRVSTFWDH